MRLLKLGLVLVCLLFSQIEAIEHEEESNPCPDDSLPCDSGQCVGRGKWCDGQKDCGDDSDEAYCKKSRWYKPDPNSCKKKHFLCDNGHCLPRFAKCDGHSDCSDGSDEKNCEPDEYEDFENTETTYQTQTEATTTEAYSQTSDLENTDFATTTTPVSTIASTKDTPFSSSVVNFYAHRMEQERGQIDSQYPTSVISRPSSSPLPSTSRPILSPIPVSPRQPVPTRLPYTSTTIYTPRYRHYNGQSNTLSHYSTRSYVNGQNRYQYSTQPTSRYDTRRDPYQYPTQPSRRDPYQYYNQPTTSYDYRRNQDQYQTRPTRPYEYGRDPYRYQTQPSRSDGFRRPNTPPTIQPQYPYHATPIPYSRNHYAEVIQRIYEDRENYYDGYYDQRGNFVVLYRSQRQQPYRRPPTDDTRRSRQDHELPTPAPAVFERYLKAPSRFYFAKDYARIYGEGNISHLRKGREWILSARNSDGGWGKNTPRALIALSLINNSFVNDTYENSMMQKHFQVYLGTRLLRGDSEVTSLNRLAMSVNALVATCQNPRNFHGTDLTDMIQRELARLEEENQRHHGDRTKTVTVNPAVYLSLCLADRDLTQFQEHDLMTRLNAHLTPGEESRDMLSFSISAFSCHLRRRQKSRDSEYRRSVESMLGNATIKLLGQMLEDGSFGNVYGTALAAQALLSLNDTKHWDPEPTFDFLKKQQKSDGSFGDFLATYLALPVLSGRSLLHLRNTQCTPPKTDRNLTPSEILAFRGPKQHVRYSLYIGHPKENGYSVDLHVPRGISFFDMMRVAQQQKNDFRFAYEERNGQIYVYSISNIPNDSERDFEWNLYVKGISDPEPNKLNPRERVQGDIREFYPRSDQHVIFWYHPSIIET